MQRLGGSRPWRGFFRLGVAVLFVFLAGCSSHQENREREQSHLKPLALLYGQYSGQRGGPPANEAQFKEFIRTQKSMLDSFGVSDPESLFVSERDGQPYVVLYGADAAGANVVAYEKEGSGGNRFVADSLGGVEEVDETRFRQLVPAGP